MLIYGIAFLVLVLLLLVGVPVLFSFGTIAIMLSAAQGFTGVFGFATMYDKMASVTLLAIPMFIMAGGIMEKGKIGDALVNFVEMFVGHIRGSLAIVATITSAIFGSISGSGAATLSCIGSIILPKMREKKYNMGKAAAVICCSAPLGLLIPPSSSQIIIAWTGGLSVLACFLSTLVPGLILTALICIVSHFLFRNDKEIIESAERAKLETKQRHSEIGARTKHVIPALLMPVIILGGIYGGFMTPSEAAAVSVFYAIPVAVWVYKGIKLREIKNVFVKTAVSTGALMIMISIMMIISQMLVVQNVPTRVFNMMTSISSNPKVILLLINLFLILLGMVMDDGSGVMLAAILLIPMADKLGISPYQMSAIIGVNLGMGNITPPTAPFLYMTSSLSKVDSIRIMKYCLIIICFAYLPTLLLTTYVPQIATFLPNLVLGV